MQKGRDERSRITTESNNVLRLVIGDPDPLPLYTGVIIVSLLFPQTQSLKNSFLEPNLIEFRTRAETRLATQVPLLLVQDWSSTDTSVGVFWTSRLLPPLLTTKGVLLSYNNTTYFSLSPTCRLLSRGS